MDSKQLASQLPDMPLWRIFSFLDGLSLIQASQVNKHWNNVAQTDSLWRDLCLKKWSFCHLSFESGDTSTWKQLYFKQMNHKFRMFWAKPEDLDCRIIAEDSGAIVNAVYLAGSDQTMSGEGNSIVFVEFAYTRPRKFILTAWDVQKGIKIWSSPDQPFKMSVIRTLPQQCLAMTYSEDYFVKVWDFFHSDAVATLSMPQACCTLEPFITKRGSFLMVGDGKGSIHTLTLPELKTICQVKVFNYSVDILKLSPNKKWIFACGIHRTVLPMVLSSENLQIPTEREIPPLLYFKISPCIEAFWAPTKPNRIILMCQKYSVRTIGFVTLDIKTEMSGNKRVIQADQIASFLLPANMGLHCNMGVYNENMIVVENGPVLNVYTIDGVLQQQFNHHQGRIVRIWTDSVHIITLSLDNSLHLYMWDERSHSPLLRSCCHLKIAPEGCKQKGPFIVQCDDVSIVSVTSDINSSRLVTYCLRT